MSLCFVARAVTTGTFAGASAVFGVGEDPVAFLCDVPREEHAEFLEDTMAVRLFYMSNRD